MQYFSANWESGAAGALLAPVTLKVFPGVAPSAMVNCGGHQAKTCGDCTEVIDFKLIIPPFGFLD